MVSFFSLDIFTSNKVSPYFAAGRFGDQAKYLIVLSIDYLIHFLFTSSRSIDKNCLGKLK